MNSKIKNTRDVSAMSLPEPTPKRINNPPRIVIYGAPKIGKTTFAASIPNNIFLDVEGGSDDVKAVRIEKDDLQTFPQFQAWLDKLENAEHTYQVLTIDTVDWLEKLIFDHAAKLGGKSNIAEVPYGAGYSQAQATWEEVLNTLDRIRKNRRMMIMLLAHEQLRQIHDPQVGQYDKYTMKLQDKDKGSSSVSIIKEWVDAILFVDQETFVTSETQGMKKLKRAVGGDRVIYTVESPAFLAGNRLGLPEQIPFEWPALEQAILKQRTERNESN